MTGFPRERKTEQGRRPFPHNRSSAADSSRRRVWGFKIKILILAIGALIISGSFLYAAKGNPLVSWSGPAQPREADRQPEPAFHPPVNGTPPNFTATAGGKFYEDREGLRLLYTVDPALQRRVQDVFQKHRPPYSVFVALAPQSGKILALAEYTRARSETGTVWQRATYPAASVFKLVTAAGALEKGLLSYDSPVLFRGNLYRLGPQKLNESARKDQRTQFDDALGKSNNVVFGRVASNLLGAQALKEFSEAFGFNHPIQFDFPVEMSRASIPEQSYELARCGAGFGEVTLNPLHAALIAATIANQGRMMRPYLIDWAQDFRGAKVYEAKQEALGQPISAKTSQDLTRMMLRTVEDGTASKIFHRYGKNLMKKMAVSGKTGSLSGINPPGQYDWFIGFAPADQPQIAFAAMIINHDRWRVRGAFVAQEALKTFFRDQL
jgi:cell division protein FtsI/penicillin-binding protein 2